VARPRTSGHNRCMGRSFVLGLSVSLAASLGGITALAFAEDAPIEQASVLVRAWGTTGSSVEPISNGSALATDVQAGSIPRALLRAEMANGIGRFLQHVRTKAVVSHGHFVGWRVLSLFAKRPDVRVSVLRAGDTILRINGESVERPEAFKSVWDGLVDAKELVLEIERDGQSSKLHYTISG
jgi:type II secretory pathway component PulC